MTCKYMFTGQMRMKWSWFKVRLQWSIGNSQKVLNCTFRILFVFQNDFVVETSLVGVVLNGLSHLHNVRNKAHFAVCLIHGLGGNLNEASREAFAKEVGLQREMPFILVYRTYMPPYWTNMYMYVQSYKFLWSKTSQCHRLIYDILVVLGSILIDWVVSVLLWHHR